MQIWNIHNKTNRTAEASTAPVQTYEATQNDLLPFYPFHWHEETELILVKEGSLEFCCDGEWQTASQNDIILFRPFCLHCLKALDSNPLRLQAITVNLRLCSADARYSSPTAFARLLNNKYAINTLISDTNDAPIPLSVRFCVCFDASRQGSDCLNVLGELLSSLPHIHDIQLAPDLTADKQCHAVRLALEYIGSNYQRRITIEDVAKHCGYSHFYIMKLFVRFTRLSCVEYANCFRLTLAEHLLAQSAKIKDIAASIGFENVSYFNRSFLRLYGKTPAEVRREMYSDPKR